MSEFVCLFVFYFFFFLGGGGGGALAEQRHATLGKLGF